MTLNRDARPSAPHLMVAHKLSAQEASGRGVKGCPSCLALVHCPKLPFTLNS